jgi:hypothetical protein
VRTGRQVPRATVSGRCCTETPSVRCCAFGWLSRNGGSVNREALHRSYRPLHRSYRLRTEKMRSILADAERRRLSAERHTKRGVGRATLRPNPPPPVKPKGAPLPPSRYDRQRLYEEVWTEPTQQVAKRYGVSDVAIAKARALLDIPSRRAAIGRRRRPDRSCRIGLRYRIGKDDSVP